MEERVVEVAKRARGSEHPETADALDTLGLLFKKIGEYTKAEPLYQEALRIGRRFSFLARVWLYGSFDSSNFSDQDVV